ncbi:hypothetical protein Btru_074253 [Bulinus truncatus]|nr:hypothetical protein Btru_074253 [Bulinus truncatus]
MNITKVLDSTIEESNSIIDYNVNNIIVVLNLLVISPVIGVLGIVANILNIENFRRQGFQDGINVSLAALSISDIGCLVAQIATHVFANPWLSQSDLTVVKLHLMSVISDVRFYFMRISGLITSFAAFERCFILYFDWKFVPEFNKSLLSVYFKDNREKVMTIYYYIAELLLPYGTISFLVVCTSILIRKLKKNAMWRRQSTSTAANYKERKLVVMLSTISLIFIACTIPEAAMNTAVSIARSLAIDGPLQQSHSLRKRPCCFEFQKHL